MTSAPKTITRTCTACRTSSDKRKFIRLVRTDTGRVEVDSTGKKSGRGAYLCADVACLTKACAADRLSSALRTKVDSENYEDIKEDFLHILNQQGE